MSDAMKKLRAVVFARADGSCECGCGRFITAEAGRLDHVFGRAKAKESLSNCWALSISCDEAKTVSRPDAATWLLKFMHHAKRYGYGVEFDRAAGKLGALAVKGRA